jgi:hypothetical protein
MNEEYDEFHLEDAPHMNWRKREAIEAMFRPRDDDDPWGDPDA